MAKMVSLLHAYIHMYVHIILHIYIYIELLIQTHGQDGKSFARLYTYVCAYNITYIYRIPEKS